MYYTVGCTICNNLKAYWKRRQQYLKSIANFYILIKKAVCFVAHNSVDVARIKTCIKTEVCEPLKVLKNLELIKNNSLDRLFVDRVWPHTIQSVETVVKHTGAWRLGGNTNFRHYESADPGSWEQTEWSADSVETGPCEIDGGCRAKCWSTVCGKTSVAWTLKFGDRALVLPFAHGPEALRQGTDPDSHPPPRTTLVFESAPPKSKVGWGRVTGEVGE